jgi:hypothetical protein
MKRLVPGCVSALLWACGVAWAQSAAVDGALERGEELPWCDEATLSKPPLEQDCVQGAGAAIGEIDPSWRQRMPPKVRWITARDAVNRCVGDVSVYGKKVGTLGDRGCVWVSDEACTILTAVYVAHAEIGNALRHCAVR